MDSNTSRGEGISLISTVNLAAFNCTIYEMGFSPREAKSAASYEDIAGFQSSEILERLSEGSKQPEQNLSFFDLIF